MSAQPVIAGCRVFDGTRHSWGLGDRKRIRFGAPHLRPPRLWRKNLAGPDGLHTLGHVGDVGDGLLLQPSSRIGFQNVDSS